MYTFEGHIFTCVSFQQYQILWKGHCMRNRIHVWHGSKHVLLKWNALPFQKKCTCWREQSFQRDARLFSRESLKAFVLTEGFDWTMSTSNSVLQTHWLPKPMFWHSLLAYFETNQWQDCQIHAPSPWTSPKVTCICSCFYEVLNRNRRPKKVC